MIKKAARFATKAHEGMLRKGGRMPYIYHPMEVALLVSRMTQDEHVIAAAYLHDVLEDTAVTAEELAAPDKVYLIAQEEDGVQLVVFGDSNSKRNVSNVVRVTVE